jgi:hypothetical protein
MGGDVAVLWSWRYCDSERAGIEDGDEDPHSLGSYGEAGEDEREGECAG